MSDRAERVDELAIAQHAVRIHSIEQTQALSAHHNFVTALPEIVAQAIR